MKRSNYTKGDIRQMAADIELNRICAAWMGERLHVDCFECKANADTAGDQGVWQIAADGALPQECPECGNIGIVVHPPSDWSGDWRYAGQLLEAMQPTESSFEDGGRSYPMQLYTEYSAKHERWEVSRCHGPISGLHHKARRAVAGAASQPLAIARTAGILWLRGIEPTEVS